jgi:hypothetical protein
MAVEDVVQVAFIGEELSILMGDGDNTFKQRYSSNPNRLDHLDLKKFKTHAETVQTHLIRGLTSKSEIDKSTRFDLQTSQLFTQGKAINIRKFTDQYDLLRVVFANMEEVRQEWLFDDVADRIDSALAEKDSKKSVKKYYNAAYQINRKLAEEGVRDFFILNTNSAKITPHYLA